MSSREPRRRPTQIRSRETVDAILEAAGRVLRTEGFASLTMKRVAQVSGVSAGTLYQYFANREALLAAWEDQAHARIIEELGGFLLELAARNPPLDMAVYRAATWGIDTFVRHSSAYARGDIDVFFSRALERHAQLEAAAGIVAAALEAAVDQHRLRDVDRLSAARIVVRALLYFARELALPFLEPAAKGGVRAAAARMVVHLLVRDADEAALNDDAVKDASGGSGP